MTVQDYSALLVDHFQCQDNAHEKAAILFIAPSMRIMDIHILHGDMDALILPIRGLLHDSLMLNASHILLIHSHPSGDPRPSSHDVAATRLLCTLLRRQRQRLLDHIILSRNLYFSFREHRML